MLPTKSTPMITDEYYTIQDEQEFEIKVKGSSFIGRASPIESREQAEHFLSAIQKKLFDATHHCYAYRAGHGPNSVFRYHDDGEPSGTAGKPIYQVITGRNLTNLIVVVTRYFGGTKLGTGGLARAYADCAISVLDRCTVQTCIIYKTIRVQFPYDQTSTIMRLIDLFEAKITDIRYDTATEMVLAVRANESGRFCSQLIDLTRGKAVVEN